MTLVNILLLGLLLVTTLWAVLSSSILRAAIGLAAVSAVLTMLMFEMESPLAGVFELSVCAGLITVIFVSTISLTRPVTNLASTNRTAARHARFLPAVGVMAFVGVVLWLTGYALDVPVPLAGPLQDVREALWSSRRLDILGLVIAILAGVFGVVILLKDRVAEKDAKADRQEANQ